MLCDGNGTCFYYFLYQDFLSAMGRQCDTVQHALYRAGSKLVWSKNRNFGWIYIWNAPVLQEPYVLSLFQVCCDYVLAFAALGVAGFFAKQKNGLLKGYIVAVLARGAFHALGGYLYWMDYMPDNFPKSLAAVYPIAYNYSFLLAEGLITIVIISIPAVQKALGRVKK